MAFQHEGDAEPLGGGVEDQLAGIEWSTAAGCRPGRPIASLHKAKVSGMSRCRKTLRGEVGRRPDGVRPVARRARRSRSPCCCRSVANRTRIDLGGDRDRRVEPVVETGEPVGARYRCRYADRDARARKADRPGISRCEANSGGPPSLSRISSPLPAALSIASRARRPPARSRPAAARPPDSTASPGGAARTGDGRHCARATGSAGSAPATTAPALSRPP